MHKQIMAAAHIAMLYSQIQVIRASDADQTAKINAINEILEKIDEVYRANA
jgi:hypothetical protein